MARVVVAAGVPHTPNFPAVVEEQGAASRVTQLFERVRSDLAAAKPDLILCFTSDHFVGFFFDNMPTFAVGTFESADGPYELSRRMPWYEVKGSPTFASGLLEYGIRAGFDLASTEELKLDHSLLVPLHFLTPTMDVPVVPVCIKALAQPMPTAERCYALGEMVGRYIASRPEDTRVAIVGSGSFSLTVGAPKMGWIDEEWVATIVDLLRRGETTELVRRSTTDRMRTAGNTGGELLNWIALLGAIGGRTATWVEPDAQPPESPRDAHAYGVWTL